MPNGLSYNEIDLLKKVAEGNEPAFRTLFDLHRDKIYYIAYRLLKTEAASEDVVQEVFIKLWLNREKLAPLDNFPAYLNTITRNHIFSQLRKLATEEAYLRELIAREKIAGDKDPADAVAFNELKRLLSEAVTQLSPQQKKVYQLGKIEGKKYEEIADALQISRETVKNHMVEALRSIKTYLRRHEQLLIILLLMAR